MMIDEKIRRIGFGMMCVGGTNFVVFCIVALLLGGDAVNGHESDGKYFLVSHGRETEVTQAVFTYSKWHARTQFVLFPLAMVGGMLWGLARMNQENDQETGQQPPGHVR